METRRFRWLIRYTIKPQVNCTLAQHVYGADKQKMVLPQRLRKSVIGDERF